MSLVTDSPAHSSSSDDFAAFLDTELDSNSSGSPDQEVEEDYDPEIERLKRRKMEKLESIDEPEDSTSHGSPEQNLEASTKKDICIHPGFFGGMCISCGQRMDDGSGVTFGYIHKELRLGNDEIARLRKADMKNLLRHKKLCLVLDLDHTLLNSTELKDLTSEEEYLRTQADSMQGNLFILASIPMMTKLRPSIHSFLKEASTMFEMYIYTMGDRFYASEMAKLLDPKKEYFNSRVISRDESTQKHQKGLDLVLGQESAVLILDDTESAWPKYKDNLMVMERYNYFASSCRQFGFNCKSLSELKTDESETDGALSAVLKVLRQIHNMFFHELTEDLAVRDVRQVLKTIRMEVLKGCKILFSHVFPVIYEANNHPLWRMAEHLGATCSTEVDSSVTHVVSADARTNKSCWALKEKKFLVHPGWIEAANYFLKKQPEEKFPVAQTKNQ